MICIGCDFSSALEQGSLRNMSADTNFGGVVSAAGAALSLPAGWSCSRIEAGVFQVNHTLGAAAYALSAMANSVNAYKVERYVMGSGLFQIILTNAAGGLVDSNFSFIVKVL